MTTTDMALASDVAALDRLEPQNREVAVTAILQQSHDWLARAQEATDPARQVSEFKAFIATVAETSKQLKLSQSIQHDSEIMVRRAERALGQAIRAGQERGEINTHGKGGGWNARKSSSVEHTKEVAASPYDYATHAELYGDGSVGGTGAYAMAEPDDETFEQALEDAKSEGNVSRRNVLRKARGEEFKSPKRKTSNEPPAETERPSREEQWEEVARLAERRLTSDQIHSKLRMYSEAPTFRKYAKERGIEFPADKFVGRGGHKFDTRRALESIVSEMYATAMAYPLIDLTQISPDEAEQMLERADEGFKALKKIMTQLKEIAR